MWYHENGLHFTIYQGAKATNLEWDTLISSKTHKINPAVKKKKIVNKNKENLKKLLN